MLTPAETRKLSQLKAKSEEIPEPLTDADLELMSKNIADVMGTSALTDLNEFWSRWCARFHELCAWNIRLQGEVSRLRALLEREES